ncbi:glycoside hydrolase family 3 N-terminal domain-containing protein [Methylopila sp. M107]|uniref:glycoside hydrolase family 3 N-terminal domain-containing protein n=1 Tax=Methylopila sp. M107 TaxID=1101190 RepID=UPI00036759A5|nr:glycoside hydrolase family 3 N-terminal domain-containing protein [Methylopila sp. M107]
MIPRRVASLALALALLASVQDVSAEPKGSPRIEGLISQMTLEEKAGQLTMNTTSPPQEAQYRDIQSQIKAGAVGVTYNVHNPVQARELQRLAVEESRLKIPILLAHDIVHGYRTMFPIALGQAASWDFEAIRKSERIASEEATADGLNMTLAPMFDISHDARWGRVVEGAGESVWLASRIAEARIKGFQGEKLSDKSSMVACVKHIGANGAVIGGREYSAADVSQRAMRQDYLPPFKAAQDAGARCFMAGLNAPDGLPTIANKWLLTDVLRKEWKFDGVVMSDFDGVKALVEHGLARDGDRIETARLAFLAGAGLDMQSGDFFRAIPKLVREGKIQEKDVDDAVRRILRLKEELGLFEAPYHGLSPDRTQIAPPTQEALDAALDLAEKSIVLLKNEGQDLQEGGKLLPLSPDVRSVAVIGPLADNREDVVGAWSGKVSLKEVVTLKEGLQKRLPNARVVATTGGRVNDSRDEEIAAAVQSARDAEVVILALGEAFGDTGEAQARSTLDLPGRQMELARAVLALGKPTVVIVMAGRPLILTELDRIAPALVNAWQLGNMTGTAIARVLFGDVEPTGRLPMTYPRSIGQVPISYDFRPTGRPYLEPREGFRMGYGNDTIRPLYAFGYGKTYTRFTFGAPRLERPTMRAGETMKVSVDIANDTMRAATAMAQLYVGVKVARVSQSMKQLRGFKRVKIEPFTTQTVELEVKADDFAYWDVDGQRIMTPGPIDIMVGPDAEAVKSAVLEFNP